MVAYEFSTRLAENGQVVIPPNYLQTIPAGSPLRIILLIEEVTAPISNGKTMHEQTQALQVLIADIKSLPPNPANITPGNMAQLADCLINPLTEPDPTFDEVAWNQEWDRIEAEMNAARPEEFSGMGADEKSFHLLCC